MQLAALTAVVAGSAPALAQPFAVDWSSIDGGGATAAMTGGSFALAGTIGQPDAGSGAGGSFACVSGFWAAAAGGAACYANCDGSTVSPLLNVNDFVCFQSRFAAADPYADCDHSGTLNVNDFVCFQSAFAAGCP